MNIYYHFPQGDGMNDFRPKSFLVALCILLALFFVTSNLHAQSSNNNHLLMSVGALHERGFDATIAYEHEARYHHAWEYFATYYVKYEEDPSVGHVTPDSFWHSYNTWHIGIVYKPCISRGRNRHGNVRIGASGGSDLNQFRGGIHIGYEHSYALTHRWELFFQVKEDVIIQGEDLFRTGIVGGVKIPL